MAYSHTCKYVYASCTYTYPNPSSSLKSPSLVHPCPMFSHIGRLSVTLHEEKGTGREKHRGIDKESCMGKIRFFSLLFFCLSLSVLIFVFRSVIYFMVRYQVSPNTKKEEKSLSFKMTD